MEPPQDIDNFGKKCIIFVIAFIVVAWLVNHAVSEGWW